MTVTVNASVVASFAGDISRPGYSGDVNQGWNNRVGDPSWIPDYDWYRRIQLSLNATTEDTRIVNWECYDATVPFKTNADLTTATAGAVASPYGTLINNSDTWTVWATTGVATAAAPKYTNTGTACVSKYRANGQRVQVLLGDRKALSTKGGVATTWTIAAFLPGAFKIPTATTTVTVTPPTPTQQPVGTPYDLIDDEEEQGLREAEVKVLEEDQKVAVEQQKKEEEEKEKREKKQKKLEAEHKPVEEETPPPPPPHEEVETPPPPPPAEPKGKSRK